MYVHTRRFHDANKIENIITMLNILEEHFNNEYPFFTFYLPENIKEFEVPDSIIAVIKYLTTLDKTEISEMSSDKIN
jgi:hypothetical protein